MDVRWMFAGSPGADHRYESQTDDRRPDNTREHEKRTLHPKAERNETKDQAMSELKLKIERDVYTIDPERVAEEIIRKLRLIKWARRELTTESGQTPQSKLRGR
jgi:anti-sigma28 factor (negative regulator of flagellin synthesis)